MTRDIEKLNKLADVLDGLPMLERKPALAPMCSLPWTQESLLQPAFFHMNFFFGTVALLDEDVKSCNTTACIGGWASILWPREDLLEIGDIQGATAFTLGLDSFEARELCIPSLADMFMRVMGEVTQKEAATCLRRLALGDSVYAAWHHALRGAPPVQHRAAITHHEEVQVGDVIEIYGQLVWVSLAGTPKFEHENRIQGFLIDKYDVRPDFWSMVHQEEHHRRNPTAALWVYDWDGCYWPGLKKLEESWHHLHHHSQD